MLDAIDEIVRVLALEALVEGEGFQAGETRDVGVADLLGGDAVAIEEFSRDLANLIVIEHDG